MFGGKEAEIARYDPPMCSAGCPVCQNVRAFGSCLGRTRPKQPESLDCLQTNPFCAHTDIWRGQVMYSTVYHVHGVADLFGRKRRNDADYTGLSTAGVEACLSTSKSSGGQVSKINGTKRLEWYENCVGTKYNCERNTTVNEIQL